MTIFQAIFLAIVQGLTEFLPVSSSGHLVLFQKIFGFSDPPVFFDVLVHFGTLMSILFFFRKETFVLIKEWKINLNIWKFLVIGSLPAVVFGLILNKKIDLIFNSLNLVAFMWIVFGLLIWSARLIQVGKKEIKGIGWLDAIIIGIFQAFALFPGVSRSGSTIIGGLWRKFPRESSFYLSFLLAIPAILGANILELKRDNLSMINPVLYIIAVVISGFVGYFSLMLLKKILLSNKFYYFGYYCLILGVLVVVLI